MSCITSAASVMAATCRRWAAEAPAAAAAAVASAAAGASPDTAAAAAAAPAAAASAGAAAAATVAPAPAAAAVEAARERAHEKTASRPDFYVGQDEHSGAAGTGGEGARLRMHWLGRLKVEATRVPHVPFLPSSSHFPGMLGPSACAAGAAGWLRACQAGSVASHGEHACDAPLSTSRTVLAPCLVEGTARPRSSANRRARRRRDVGGAAHAAKRRARLSTTPLGAHDTGLCSPTGLVRGWPAGAYASLCARGWRGKGAGQHAG
eukprot:33395-Chlamydomonas_euryale.AAC.1